MRRLVRPSVGCAFVWTPDRGRLVEVWGPGSALRDAMRYRALGRTSDFGGLAGHKKRKGSILRRNDEILSGIPEIPAHRRLR